MPAIADRPTQLPAQTTWRWMWPVIGAAFVVRLVASIHLPAPIHPDEVFQYLEQAHRLTQGYGVIPWEYVYGIRSWLIPWLISLVLELCFLSGLDRPSEYGFVVGAVFSLLSLSLPIGMYRAAQLVTNERAAIFALLLGCFWLDFVFLGPKPMPGAIATYVLVWACYAFLLPTTRNSLFAIGLLLGLVVGVRYQLLPVVGCLGLCLAYQHRLGAWPALVSGGLVTIAFGLVDLLAWGGFLFSFVENFRLNFLDDISSVFGREPGYFYLQETAIRSGAILWVSLVGVAFLNRRAYPFLTCVGVGIVALHIPAHKEYRFITFALPFLLIAFSALLAALVGSTVAQGRRRMPISAVLILWIGATIAANAYFRSGPPGSHERSLVAMRQVFHAIAEDSPVTGVEMLTPSMPWWDTFGYFGLGHRVPIYFAHWHDRLPMDVRSSRLGHVSHVITEDPADAPAGFELLVRKSSFHVWKRVGPATSEPPAAFDLRAPLPTEKLEAIPPRTGLRGGSPFL